MNTLNTAQARYTTKAYDSAKKIPEDTFHRLVEALRLTPSSINIQPWHFIVAEHNAAKQRIATALVGRYAYNAPKVLESSHTIILCTRKDIDAAHLELLLSHDEQHGRFKDENAKLAQQTSRSGYVDYYRNEKGDIQRWMENQTFIALGSLLTYAAAEHIDATAIGGFDEALLCQALNLDEKGLIPSVIVSLGYRSETDFNAKLPKSRLAAEHVISYL